MRDLNKHSWGISGKGKSGLTYRRSRFVELCENLVVLFYLGHNPVDLGGGILDVSGRGGLGRGPDARGDVATRRGIGVHARRRDGVERVQTCSREGSAPQPDADTLEQAATGWLAGFVRRPAGHNVQPSSHVTLNIPNIIHIYGIGMT